MMTLIHYSALGFLRYAERRAGEFDLIVGPRDGPFLNYTKSISLLNDPQMRRNTARVEAGARITFCEQSLQSDCQLSATCLNTTCPNNKTVTLILIDSIREDTLSIGTEFFYKQPLAPSQVLVHESVAESLRPLATGNPPVVYLTLGVQDIFRPIYDQLFGAIQSDPNWRSSSQEVPKLNDIPIKLSVAGIIQSNGRKFKEDRNRFIVMELANFWLSVINNLPNDRFVGFKRAMTEAISRKYRSVLDEEGMNPRLDYVGQSERGEKFPFLSPTSSPIRIIGVEHEMVNQILFRVPTPSVYAHNFETSSYAVGSWASSILFTLGYTSLTSTLPIISELQYTEYVSLFLTFILSLVIVALVGLCSWLCWCVITTNLEERRREIGVFRMVGDTKSGAIKITMMQTFVLAIPSTIIALIAANITFFVLRPYLAPTTYALPPFLTTAAFITAVILGLLVPLFSAIFPARQALRQSLTDSLAQRAPTFKIKVVKFRRAQSSLKSLFNGIDWGFLSGVLILTLILLGIYLLIPFSLATGRFTLLFLLFLVVLVGTIFGLCLLFLNFQGLLEAALLWVLMKLFWFENRGAEELVGKNLKQFRRRNKRTSLGYGVCLAFVIIFVVSVRTHFHGQKIEIQMKNPTHISISLNHFSGTKATSLPVPQVQNFTNSLPYVESIAFSTYPLSTILPQGSGLEVTNLGQTVHLAHDVFGVSPNFFETVGNDDTVKVDEYSDDYERFDSMDEIRSNLAKVISRSSNQNTVLTSSWLLSDRALSLNSEPFATQVLFRLLPSNTSNADNSTSIIRHSIRPIAYLKTAPMFKGVSEFPPRSSVPTMSIASLATYMSLTNNTYTSTETLPIQNIHIKLKYPETYIPPDVKSSMITALRNVLSESLPPGIFPTISNLPDEVEAVEKTNDMFNIVFLFVMILPVLLGVVSLGLSVFVKIMEMKKEIVILRCIGVQRNLLIRAIMWENVIVMISATFIGTLIGVVVAYVVNAQRVLFVRMETAFVFPWDMFLVAVAGSVVAGIVAALIPLKSLGKSMSLSKELKQ
ncbi:hypothetical protein BKA69DRAFT_1054263 [Paraphysoderma sedebokerense]|nr:hypothetical protein BKA69DRAFT_1054263 [Paraphysoderma sedebokerense]